ncbi:MAG: hypothetical protein NTW69_06420 [Chloroflexi bacterium]|nr:hypothetical protein [Chloroflexota bacterium]
MTEEIIKQKLDTLAEFYSQKDALELSKRELLDEVKVPAEIEQIVSEGMKEAEQADSEYGNSITLFSKQINERIASVVIPQEYKDALAELDRQRAEIISRMGEVEQEKRAIKSELDDYSNRQQQFHNTRKNEIRAKIDRQTRDVYAAINQRKDDIEAEFRGKAQDVDANIKKLEAEIKADVKAAGSSVKGQFFHAVYVKGRVTWNTDKMDAWCNDHPFLKEARKEGEPSITLRKV